MIGRRDVLGAAGLLAPGVAMAGEEQVSFPFRVTRNVPWTAVHINGKEPGLPFALDTGSTTFRIVDAKAREMRLPRRGKVPGQGAVGRAEVSAYEADLLVGGAVRFDDTDLYGLASQGASVLQGAVPLTQAYVMGFDFDAQQAFVSRRMPEAPDGYTALELDRRETHGRPIVTAEFDGQPVKLLVDTGYAGGLFLYADYVKSRGLWDHYPKRAEGMIRSRAGEGATRLVRAERLKLGKVVFANPFAMLVDPEAADRDGHYIIDGRIGFDHLRRFNLIHDPVRKQLWIKTNKAIADGYRIDRAGGMVGLIEGEGQVISVRVGGPADRAGLKQGDKVTGWRGRDGIEGLQWAMLGAPGSKVEIQLEREGKPLMVAVTLEDPV